MRYLTSDLKPGLIVVIKNNLMSILSIEFFKPGKGPCFYRIKMKDVLTGAILDRTCKPAENFDIADTVMVDASFSYEDQESLIFINTDTYDQYAIDKNAVGDLMQWITEGAVCSILLHSGKVVQVSPPTFVNLEVVSEESVSNKNDTSTPSGKKVKLVTGFVISVPSFVKKGEMLKIDTRTGVYVGRIAKEK